MQQVGLTSPRDACATLQNTQCIDAMSVINAVCAKSSDVLLAQHGSYNAINQRHCTPPCTTIFLKWAGTIAGRVAEAEVTEHQVAAAREAYRTPATAAAGVWLVLCQLARRVPESTTSLASFAAAFEACIASTPSAATLQSRLDLLQARFVAHVYMTTARGLFARHRAAFGFALAAADARARGEISDAQCRHLLALDTAVSIAESPPPSRPLWCSPSCWAAVHCLELLAPSVFGGIGTAMSAECCADAAVAPVAEHPSGNTAAALGSWQALLSSGVLQDFFPPCMLGGMAIAGSPSSRSSSSSSNECMLDKLLLEVAASRGSSSKQQLVTPFQRLLIVQVWPSGALSVIPQPHPISCTWTGMWHQDDEAAYMQQTAKRLPHSTRCAALLQAIRGDLLGTAMRAVACAELERSGAKEPPPCDLAGAHHESTPGTPLLLLLAPGVDAVGELGRFALGHHGRVVGAGLTVLSLAGGGADAVQDAVMAAAREGAWICLEVSAVCVFVHGLGAPHLSRVGVDQQQGLYSHMCQLLKRERHSFSHASCREI